MKILKALGWIACWLLVWGPVFLSVYLVDMGKRWAILLCVPTLAGFLFALWYDDHCDKYGHPPFDTKPRKRHPDPAIDELQERVSFRTKCGIRSGGAE